MYEEDPFYMDFDDLFYNEVYMLLSVLVVDMVQYTRRVCMMMA